MSEIRTSVIGFNPHPYRMRLEINGFSHGLKSVHRTLFAPVCALVPAFRIPLDVKIIPTPDVVGIILAERVGFEPTVGCPITSFQDWLLKPLGHLSIGVNIIIPRRKCQVVSRSRLRIAVPGTSRRWPGRWRAGRPRPGPQSPADTSYNIFPPSFH